MFYKQGNFINRCHFAGSLIAKMIVYWISFLLVGLCEGNIPAPPAAEEWVLNFDSPVYVCSDETSQKFVDTSGIEVRRFNETVATMAGAFQFLRGIEPCTVVELIVEKDKNGRVEVLLTHDICDLCVEIGNGPDSSYHKYLKYLGIPDVCPFDAGTYKIHDFVPDSNDMPVNQANAATYRVTINFYNNPGCDCKEDRTFIGCLKLDFVIEAL